MSNSDYVSNIKTIPHPQLAVFEKLSDLTNLQAVKDRLSEPGAEERLKEMAREHNQEKLGEQFSQLKDKLGQLEFDRDSLTIGGTPLGNISLRIVERDEPKTIKFEGQGTPIPVTLWIQLLPLDSYTCKMRITLRAELNFFLRQMAGKHLQEGVEKMADILASLPY